MTDTMTSDDERRLVGAADGPSELTDWIPDALVITVPGTPPKALSPNRVGDRRNKAREVAALRRTACYAALGQRGTVGGGPIFRGPVAVTERIAWGRGERRTDLDAVPLLCKAIIDGICDALIIGNDSQVRRLIVEDHVRDPAGVGFVEVVICGMEETE